MPQWFRGGYCNPITKIAGLLFVCYASCAFALARTDASIYPTNGSISTTTSSLPQSSNNGIAGHSPNAVFDSDAALVVQARTGAVIFQKNIHQQLPVASITKLMSAMVILDAHLPMEELITITEEDIDLLKRSFSRLKVGTCLSRREALLLAIMSSENRAAFALARTYPGGVSAFIAAMNKKAESLGMQNTVFSDPTGLSPNNLSTAADLLLMVKAAYTYSFLKENSTHDIYDIQLTSGNQLTYRNSNPLIRDKALRINLQKTGFTKEAGRCMVVYTHFNGQPYIFILLGARNKAMREQDIALIKTSLAKRYCFLWFCYPSQKPEVQ